jgi:protein-S-isoprenylcysteine O-methyltransferase Ste14
MRSPIRLKNFRRRFLPYYAAGLIALMWADPTPLGLGVGTLLVLCGGAVRTWGAGHLVKNHQLIVTGPYAKIRHPLYAGTLLVGAGFALMVGGWFSPPLLVGFVLWFLLHYFPRKERIESQRLERLYGSAYHDYCIHVPALIPKLRSWRPAATSSMREEPELSWSPKRYLDNNELGTLLALALGLTVIALRFGPPTL